MQFPDLNVVIAMAGIMSGEEIRRDGFLAEAERIVETNINGPLRLPSAFTAGFGRFPEAEGRYDAAVAAINPAVPA